MRLARNAGSEMSVIMIKSGTPASSENSLDLFRDRPDCGGEAARPRPLPPDSRLDPPLELTATRDEGEERYREKREERNESEID